ncbi:MAG: hypothetical protein E7471_04755 [Ruminococcaceae bacterium]|nr:hypothetical protein [Oscillospiraceae bacterium]
MKKLLLCIPFLALLCGCWDYNEPNMQEYVLGIGVDLTQDDTYLLTVETANLSTPPESAATSRTLSAEGVNLFDAIQNISTRAGKKLYWGHLGLIVIDEKITGAQLHAVLDLFNRTREVYLNTALLVAHNTSAQNVFQTETTGASSVSEHCLNILENRSSSRRLQNLELWEYTRDLSERDCVLLPKVTVSDQALAIDGGVVYRETDHVASLTGDEVLALSLLTETDPGGFLAKVELSPNHTVSLEILSSHVSKETDAVTVTLSISVSAANFYLDLENNNIETVVQDLVQKKLTAFISRAYAEGFASLLDFSSPTPPRVNVFVRLHHAGMYHDHPEDAA